MKKISKTEAERTIEEFFSSIKTKTPSEIKKIKKFAMRNSIKLKEKRKLFCKKCFSVYRSPKIRIKEKKKIVVCENCGNIGRWKVREK